MKSLCTYSYSKILSPLSTATGTLPEACFFDKFLIVVLFMFFMVVIVMVIVMVSR